MNFAKLQATGNDFILIDARSMEHDWPRLARDMCHRHFGVGADGLILIMNSDNADLKMRLFNPDGSEAEISGNGLRCFAKYAIDRKIAPGPGLIVETLSGIRTVQVSLSQQKVCHARVNMGKPRFKPQDIPVLIDYPESNSEEVEIKPIIEYPLDAAGQRLDLSFVSIGNPHAVSFVNQELFKFPLHEIGPQIENLPMFPERVNFEIARAVSHNTVEARVWERGVGETLSCGSGACAVAVIAMLKGYTGNEVDIILPGGNLTVSWDRIGEIYLSGPVEEVFTGEWLN